MDHIKLHIAAIAITNDLNDVEDEQVSGVYQVLVQKGLSSATMASAALDRFHSDCPVGVLDDFAFHVYDPITGRVLEEDEASESYANTALATDFERIGDALPGIYSVKIDAVDAEVGSTRLRLPDLHVGTVLIAGDSKEDAQSKALHLLWVPRTDGRTTPRYETALVAGNETPEDKLRLFTVTLPWSDDAEEGDYATSKWATNADHAIRTVAEEMGNSGEMVFDSASDKNAWIEATIKSAGASCAEDAADVATGYLEQLLSGPDGELSDQAKADLAQAAAILAKYGVLGDFVPESAPAPRVLVTVSGGIADFACDDGLDVVVFDFDDFHDDPRNTPRVPAHFADLAAQMAAPVVKPAVPGAALGM